MSTKTTGTFVPASETFVETKSNGPPYASKPTYGEFGGKQSSGSEIPGYYGKIRRGDLLPITTWWQFEVSGSFSGGREYKDSAGTTYTQAKPHTNNWPAGTRAYIDSTFASSFIEPDLLDNVATRAFVSLTSSTHDSLTFAAELGKTVSMFRGISSRILDLTSSLSPNKWASAWLEGRYGWRTLSYDMQSMAKAIEELDKRSQFYKATSHTSDNQHVVETSSWTHLDSTLENTLDINVEVSYRGLCVGKLKPPSFGGDLITTGWELVPFSFVIDWFFDIGLRLQALSSATLTGDYSIGAGTKTTISGTSTTSILSSSGTGTYQYISNNATANMEATLVTRAPHPVGFLPSWNPRLDSLKVVDLVSLLIQRFSK